ncbi:MAG: TRCF domain-containing protein, partial [Bacteroidota bacterium]
IAEGIQYEMSRGGQVFFIHNRVQNILEVETLINRTVPQAKTVVAHGQMEGPKLEKIMLDFISGDYDVLIATSIIESGLDIPNANTIFINNAHHFGLSDLHQLRGRVGRSNRKAFCYLLAPPVTVQTPEARRRLKAIEEFSELGSGFNIAMQDLDIRGAGDLLGAEQSGFITDIGLETYQRILNEAMLELRENEYKELFSSEKATSDKEGETSMEIQQFVSDCIIDTDLELLFPDSYIENITERLRLYRQLDNINETEELEKFEQMLEDRFGPLPKPTKELMQVVRLRWLGNSLGMEKIILKYSKMVCHFVSNQESGFYQSPVFTHILQFFQENPTVFSLKETREKLTITAERIDSVSNAIQKLSLLNYNNVPAE